MTGQREETDVISYIKYNNEGDNQLRSKCGSSLIHAYHLPFAADHTMCACSIAGDSDDKRICTVAR